MHVILVDNGRSIQLGKADFRNSLKCIRCAACFNTCPVYRRSGGHSYHTAIAGPIGSILAPNLDMKKYADLPFASTLCGSCSNVCPVKIDIHNQLYKWRQVLVKEGYAPALKKAGMKGITFTLNNPALYQIAGKAGRWFMRNTPFILNNRFNPWYKQRNMPAAPKQSFTDWYKRTEKISMSSRDKVLNTVKQNQPAITELPAIINYDQQYPDVVEKFIDVLQFIGAAFLVKNYEHVINIIKENFAEAKRIVSTCTELSSIAEVSETFNGPHQLANVDLFITQANLAVAENGAIWMTDNQLRQRALPFITQQIAVVVNKENIFATMHDAYDVIADVDYGYAAFIAGPSKTADIEQSLVLGAHGPKTMTVFLMG